jgi:hypothetical protein
MVGSGSQAAGESLIVSMVGSDDEIGHEFGSDWEKNGKSVYIDANQSCKGKGKSSMRRSLSTFFAVSATLTLLSCGPSEADQQQEAQARRDSLAQVLAQRESVADSTQSTTETEMQQEFDFSDSGRFVVQVGSWRSETKAEELAGVWKRRGYPNAFTESFGNESTGDVWFRVRLGRMPSSSDADALVRLIKDRHGLVAWVDTITTP